MNTLNQKIEVFRLNSNNKFEFEKLLATSYATAEGFYVKPEGLKWTQADDRYISLGLRLNEKIVSVMRLESIHHDKEFKYKLNTHIPGIVLQYPLGYLTKAATSPEIKNTGYNSILRLMAIKICRKWNFKYLLGSMVEHSPRIYTMKKMGYQFYKIEQKWNGGFVSESYPLLAILDLQKNGQSAEDYLTEKIVQNEQSFEVQFNLSDLKIPVTDEILWPWNK